MPPCALSCSGWDCTHMYCRIDRVWPLPGLWWDKWVPSTLITSCKNWVTPALSRGRTFTRRLVSPTSELIGREQSDVEVSGWEARGWTAAWGWGSLVGRADSLLVGEAEGGLGWAGRVGGTEAAEGGA